ncbi:hypothetical protein QOZ80_7BG0602170 [Eleusine coracana subsp. coracana]|nr:hypothetical protein QOZ80_7BG0602170 [Eleusine coracana subsp. coracana]
MQTGPKWLLILFENQQAEAMENLLMLIWRTWHLRNNLTQASVWLPIEGTDLFLTNYLNSLRECRVRSPDVPSHKMTGKGGSASKWWKPTKEGVLKINVDEAFNPASGVAGLGVIIRDHVGQPLLTVWRVIFNCQYAEEAKATACLDGVRLAGRWPDRCIVLESDCASSPR